MNIEWRIILPMSTSIVPVIYSEDEVEGYLDDLSGKIKASVGTDSDLLLDHPAIYIHVWRSNNDVLNGKFSVYIGETNNIVERTKEHWNAAKIPRSKRKSGNWQYHMLEDVDENGKKVIPKVYFFGHKLFHKSLTLDIENRLIDYCYAMSTANVYNGRTNPQGSYSGDDNLDDIFSMIWKRLRKENPFLFLPESYIQKSAIFKASPNHKLTVNQKIAKQLIIDRTVDSILNNKTGQLIFVEGEAGTGKTVLASSTFYDMIENELFKELDLKCYMLINHREQLMVYRNIARKLGYSEDIIQVPTTFLKHHSKLDSRKKEYLPDLNNMADIVFVDEAHLLWTQNNQAYDSKFKNTQLDEIVQRSRVTVIMFDENQVLHKGQLFTLDYMNKKRELSKSQGPDPVKGRSNYIVLNDQLRMNCSAETMLWIDDLSKKHIISELHLSQNKDSEGYEIKIFDDPKKMHDAIKQKASKEESQLSRVVATCDWAYKNNSAPKYPKHYWDIAIGDWSIPWNEEIYWRDKYPHLNKRDKKKYKSLDWAEKDYSVEEAGSTFTIQGFDLSYVGVILGPSVKYDKINKCVVFNESLRYQDYMKGNRTLKDGLTVNVSERISANELRVLLTRGTKGLYIYACDDDLRAELHSALKH